MKQEGFSLQGTSRTTEGGPHPDRDAQFHCINGQVREFTEAGDPVMSVDARKKEVLGDCTAIGQGWHRSGASAGVRATTTAPRRPRDALGVVVRLLGGAGQGSVGNSGGEVMAPAPGTWGG